MRAVIATDRHRVLSGEDFVVQVLEDGLEVALFEVTTCQDCRTAAGLQVEHVAGLRQLQLQSGGTLFCREEQNEEYQYKLGYI